MEAAEAKKGIKETKEVLVGVNEFSLFMIARAKDGLGFDDALALFANSELKAHLAKAFEDVKEVKAELNDLDLEEGLDLAKVQISYVPKIVAAVKAKA